MGLKQIVLLTEEEIPVKIVSELTMDLFDIEDPELPENYENQVEIGVLDEEGLALEAIYSDLAREGMCTATARRMEQYMPGYVRKRGGQASFTSYPSLEELQPGKQTITQRLMEIISKVRKYVADLYNQFKTWLVAKFSKPEAVEVKEEVATFVAKRQNKLAMTFMSDLPDDIAKAAYEISTYAGGDGKAFATELTNQLTGMKRGMESIEKQLQENATHFRLATGIMTVKELYKSGADDVINQMFTKAADTANAAMKTRNYGEFQQAIENIDAVTAELVEFEKGFTVNDNVNESQGEGKAVRLDSMFDNINVAAVDLERIDIKVLVTKMTTHIELIVDVSANTKLEEIIEMIPEDVPSDQHSVMAQKVASLYRRVAKLGADVLKLWKLRADSVTTLNRVGTLLIGLVSSFEKAIADCAATLTAEQKTKLTKSLGDRGFTIQF